MIKFERYAGKTTLNNVSHNILFCVHNNYKLTSVSWKGLNSEVITKIYVDS